MEIYFVEFQLDVDDRVFIGDMVVVVVDVYGSTSRIGVEGQERVRRGELLVMDHSEEAHSNLKDAPNEVD